MILIFALLILVNASSVLALYPGFEPVEIETKMPFQTVIFTSTTTGELVFSVRYTEGDPTVKFDDRVNWQGAITASIPITEGCHLVTTYLPPDVIPSRYGEWVLAAQSSIGFAIPVVVAIYGKDHVFAAGWTFICFAGEPIQSNVLVYGKCNWDVYGFLSEIKNSYKLTEMPPLLRHIPCVLTRLNGLSLNKIHLGVTRVDYSGFQFNTD